MEVDVTRDNFEESLKEITKHVSTCDFVAIDTEFTGLTPDIQHRTHYFDEPESRYTKLAFSARQFLLLQFGISTFTWKKEEKQWVSAVWNCHLFPTAKDSCYLLQTDSINFLSKYHYDFNKTFQKGINWLRPDDEYKIRSKKEPRLPPHLTKEATLKQSASSKQENGLDSGNKTVCMDTKSDHDSKPFYAMTQHQKTLLEPYL